MPTYCYFDDYGDPFESTQFDLPFPRDYKREAVGIGTGVRASKDTARESMVPTRELFEERYGPKADEKIKEWNETHEPEHSGGNKYRPR